GTTNNLYGVWGDNSRDVFVVGETGTIRHYDGTAWTTMSSGTTNNLYGVWGDNGRDVFVVGESGTIVNYDGDTWDSMSRNTLSLLRGIWGFSSTDIFSTGWSGTILRYFPPIINSVSPVQGNQNATFIVTINGMNLTGASAIQFGAGIAVNNFMVVSPNQIKANITIVTGATIGSRDVSITTPGGISLLPNCFTVQPALTTIVSVSPDQGRQAITLDVTVTGTKLTGTSAIQFGAGIAVNNFKVVSPNQMTANITIASDATIGARDVSVIAPGGSFARTGGFMVQQALPAIISVSPDRSNREITDNVTISGANLTGASEMQFGAGIAVNNFKVVSPNQMTANITIASDATIGARDVSVTTPGGSFVLPNCFAIRQALPVITAVSPDNGNQGATLNITVSGMNFTGASEVQFGTDIAVNKFSVLDANQIMANITIIGGAETGTRTISVTTPGDSFSLPNSFKVKQGLPIIMSISPNEGSQGATITVIISGSNLNGATEVSLGTGIVVQSLTNLSPTQISSNIMIDSEAVTQVRDVLVTTSGGRSTLGNSFKIKEKSLSTLIVALIWVGIAVVAVLFVLILNILRKNKADKVQNLYIT
ncbi:IPT/TIG domain-containing protein, partial [Chloroflexota bacterium]